MAEKSPHFTRRPDQVPSCTKLATGLEGDNELEGGYMGDISLKYGGYMTNDWSESMNWEFYTQKPSENPSSPPRLLPQLVIFLEVGGFPQLVSPIVVL